MLLHLGGDWAADTRRIIAIFNYASVSNGRSVKRLIEQARQQRLLDRIDAAQIRSLILLEHPAGLRLVLSPISAAALKGRLAAADGLGIRKVRKGR